MLCRNIFKKTSRVSIEACQKLCIDISCNLFHLCCMLWYADNIMDNSNDHQQQRDSGWHDGDDGVFITSSSNNSSNKQSPVTDDLKPVAMGQQHGSPISHTTTTPGCLGNDWRHSSWNSVDSSALTRPKTEYDSHQNQNQNLNDNDDDAVVQVAIDNNRPAILACQPPSSVTGTPLSSNVPTYRHRTATMESGTKANNHPTFSHVSPTCSNSAQLKINQSSVMCHQPTYCQPSYNSQPSSNKLTHYLTPFSPPSQCSESSYNQLPCNTQPQSLCNYTQQRQPSHNCSNNQPPTQADIERVLTTSRRVILNVGG